MRLLKIHRAHLTDRLVAATLAERRLRLKQAEHALAVRLLLDIYGADLFERIKQMPEGWLPVGNCVNFHILVADGRTHRTVHLLEYTRLPHSASLYQGVADYAEGHPFAAAYYAHREAERALQAEERQLKQQVRTTLEAFTTVEKLAADWPEGYAYFPHDLVAGAPTNLPALRVEDLNRRLAAAREAA